MIESTHPPKQLYYDHGQSQRNFDAAFKARTLKDWEFTFQNLQKQESKFSAEVCRIKHNITGFLRLPTVEFAARKIQEGHRLLILESCGSGKVIQYATLLNAHLASSGGSREVSVVTSKTKVSAYTKAAIRLHSYMNYVKIDKSDLVVADCPSSHLLDVCSTVLSSESTHLPSIIFASTSTAELLKKWNKQALKPFTSVKTRCIGVDVEYLDRNADMDESLKGALAAELGDVAVLCDLEKIKELTSLAHQSKALAVNCLEVKSGVEAFSPTTTKHVILAETSSALAEFLGRHRLGIRAFYDYNTNRAVRFDYEKGHYTEVAESIDAEELTRRLGLAFDIGAVKYYLINKGGVLNTRESLAHQDIGSKIIRYGKEVVSKIIGVLDLQDLAESLAHAQTYFGKAGVDPKGLKIEWDSIPEGVFANELLALLPHISNAKAFNLHLLAFAYLRNTVGRLIEKKARLTEVRGDFEIIQHILSHFKSFEAFLKEQTSRKKRKLSDASGDGQKLFHNMSIVRQQSSFKEQGKGSSTETKLSLHRFKFNSIFVVKWAQIFEHLSGDTKIDFQPSDFECIKCHSDPIIYTYSKALRKYVDPTNKHHYVVNKNAIIGQILPTVKHIHIIKTINNQILVSQKTQPTKQEGEEAIIQFNQVTTTIFPADRIKNFEQKHNCEVLLNPEFQSLIISCNASNKQKLSTEFKELLQECIGVLKNEVVFRKHGLKSLLFSNGGVIVDVSKPNSQNQTSTTIAIRNLPYDWTQRDVRELLDDYSYVQSITMRKNRENPNVKDAVVEFSGSNDSLNVYKIFDGQEVFGNVLTVCKPTDIKNPFMKDRKEVILKWFTHKTDKTGEVVFATEEATRKGLEELKDYANVQESLPSEGLLVLRNLEEWVDEDYIRQLYEPLGQIVSIKLRKIALNEKDNSQLLRYHMSQAITSDAYTLGPISTTCREIGQRQVTVSLENIFDINTVFDYFNSKRDLLGKARTYAKKHIEYTYLASEVLIKLVREFLENQFKKEEINREHIKINVTRFDDENYLTVVASDTSLFMMVTNRIEQIQAGALVKPDPEGMCFTEFGNKAVLDIKSKFICEINLSPAAKKINVICNPENLEAISKQIMEIPKKKVSLEYRLTKRMFDVLLTTEEYLTQINKIVEAEILLDNSSLMLTGEIQKLGHVKDLIKTFSKDMNKKLVSMEEKVCEICLMPFDSTPVKLMVCGHVFCKDCLMGHMDNCLANFDQFPLKCPSCLDNIAFRDIDYLLDEPERYNKLKKIAINEFISKHSDVFCYCITPGCEGIGWITTAKTVCEYCNKQYCLACKKPFHGGMTCWQASVGAEELFKRYIANSDSRKCPNKKCSAVIQKNGGCNKVLCAMCKMSICWKCMKHFQQQNQAYQHLNAKHGGYFDN